MARASSVRHLSARAARGLAEGAGISSDTLARVLARVGAGSLRLGPAELTNTSSQGRQDHRPYPAATRPAYGFVRWPFRPSIRNEEVAMTKEIDLAYYVAVYDSVDSARADLDAIEQLHKDDLIGTFDAAIVDKENGKPHIVKRMARPMVRVIPDFFGDDFALLPYDELHGAAAELNASEAGLIVVGEPTLDKAFDKAVTHATKTLKHVVDATADELAKEMKEAVGT